jgi:kumamolisin
VNKPHFHSTTLLAVAAFAALCVPVAGHAADGAGAAAAVRMPSDRVALTGHVLPALATATVDQAKSSSPTADEPLTLTVVLNRTDPAGFAEYLRDVYDPASLAFRKFLTPTQVSDRFGPHREDYSAVKTYFAQHGFLIVDESANRMTLSVRGARSNAARALNVQIGDYVTGKRAFFANVAEPELPAALAFRVQAVAGLSNLAAPQPLREAIVKAVCSISKYLTLYFDDAGLEHNYKKCLKDNGVSQAAGALAAPDPPPPAWQGVDGTGQKVGIVAFDTFLLSDVANYFALAGIPAAKIANVTKVPVLGGAASGPNQSEVLLDIALIMSNASGVQIAVYDAPIGAGGSYQAVLNAMISGGVNIVSNSWAYCEDQTSLADVQSIDVILQTAAASGISVFSASGDRGSTCLNGSANTAHVPATSPHITAVGGTTLTIGVGDTYGGETWWDASASSPPGGQGGFGVSRFFSRPAYQNGLNASPMRSVPDVAANADPRKGYAICHAASGGCPSGLLYGGTSAAAPAWAAFAALLNQAGGASIGFFNPIMYPLASTDAFYTAASMGSDFAHVGLGSPNLPLLHRRLTAQTVGVASANVSEVRVYSEDNFTLPDSATTGLPVPADGLAKGYVVVRLADNFGNVVAGKTVSLAASGGSAVITPSSGISSASNGVVKFAVTNLTAETITFTATDVTEGVVLTQTAKIAFGVPLAAGGSIVALTGSAAANGVSTDTITVTLQDSLARPARGKTVALSQTGNSVIKGPSPSVTNASGQIQFTVTNTRQENVIYTAFDVSDGDLLIPGTASVNFSAGGGDNCGNTNFGDPNISAAPGYAMTPFATGFLPKNTNFGGVGYGCRGVSGIAFDAAGNLFAGDIHSGNIYKFGPTGGVAGAATLLTPTPIEPGMGGLTFGLDGKLYVASNSTTGNFFTGAVREINPVTGAVVRTVASSLTCASYLATDPLSGDLFVDDSCSGAGSDNGSIWRINNPGSATPTTTVYATTPGVNGGVTFSTGGTLYVLSYTQNGVARVSGTNQPQPATLSVLPGLQNVALNVVAIGAQPNGDAQTLVIGTAPDASGFPAGIKAFDTTTNPVTTSSILVNNAYANVQIIGPDGCHYASMAVAVYKITNADGSCPLAIGGPSLALSPPTVAPNPAQGSDKSFTASFHYTTVPAGTPLFFVVTGANAQQKQVLTDATGKATFTYTGVNVGTDTIIASGTANGVLLTSSPAKVTWTNGLHATVLDLNLGPTGGVAGTRTTLSATLIDVSVTPSTAIAGAAVQLSVGSQSCSGVTNASGAASCSFILTTVGNFTFTASYAGSGAFSPASASTGFSVVAPTKIDIDGNGRVDALSDGLLIQRWLSALTGTALTNVAIGTGATRITPADISAYLNALRPMLDVDGNGQFDAATDGLLIVRYLFGLRGDALIAGAVASGAPRNSSADIEAYIGGLLPRSTSFP